MITEALFKHSQRYHIIEIPYRGLEHFWSNHIQQKSNFQRQFMFLRFNKNGCFVSFNVNFNEILFLKIQMSIKRIWNHAAWIMIIKLLITSLIPHHYSFPFLVLNLWGTCKKVVLILIIFYSNHMVKITKNWYQEMQIFLDFFLHLCSYLPNENIFGNWIILFGKIIYCQAQLQLQLQLSWKLS